MFNQKTLCLENYSHPYTVWPTYNLKFSVTSVSFSFRLYCWRGPMIAALCLNGTPDSITLTKYGIISLFKHWWLYFSLIMLRNIHLLCFNIIHFKIVMHLWICVPAYVSVMLSNEILSSEFWVVYMNYQWDVCIHRDCKRSWLLTFRMIVSTWYCTSLHM